MDPYTKLVNQYRELEYRLKNTKKKVFSSVVTTTRLGEMDLDFRSSVDHSARPVRVPVCRFEKEDDFTDVIKSLLKKDKRRIDAMMYVKNRNQTKSRKWR